MYSLGKTSSFQKRGYGALWKSGLIESSFGNSPPKLPPFLNQSYSPIPSKLKAPANFKPQENHPTLLSQTTINGRSHPLCLQSHSPIQERGSSSSSSWWCMVQWVPFGLVHPATERLRSVPHVGDEQVPLLLVTPVARGSRVIGPLPFFFVPSARLKIIKVIVHIGFQ